MSADFTYCARCGVEVPQVSRFCGKCGLQNASAIVEKTPASRDLRMQGMVIAAIGLVGILWALDRPDTSHSAEPFPLALLNQTMPFSLLVVLGAGLIWRWPKVWIVVPLAFLVMLDVVVPYLFPTIPTI